MINFNNPLSKSIKPIKRFATLLEVLIAMVLTVLVISTLTFFYRQIAMVGYEIDQVKKTHFAFRFLENRLSDIVPMALPATDSEFTFISTASDELTQKGSQSLIFAYDNQISLDKQFSNQVIARLYVSQSDELMVAYWPARKNLKTGEDPPMKNEVLMEGVESLKFAFFVAPEVKEPTKKEGTALPSSKGAEPTPEDEKKSPEPKGAWTENLWLNEYKELPLIIKIEIKLKENQELLQFRFPLSNAQAHIIYE